MSLPSASWKPSATMRGGPSKRLGWASLSADRHQRAVVRAAHPALDRPGRRERLDDLADGGEVALAADDHRRVVLADVAAGDERELVGAGHGADLAAHAVEDALDGVAGRGADEDEQVVELVGGVERDLLVVLDVLDLEAEALVQRLGDDEARRC